MKNKNTMKRAIQGSTGLMTILIALGASGMPAVAQEPSAAQKEEGRPDGTSTPFIEEIIITAQRRDQNLSKVGISVTALGADLIRQQNIDDLGKVAALVPGLDIFRGNGSNNPTITLRGIGTTNPWANNNQSVASYVDGVYLPFSSYLTFPLFDLARIEVLKGPQIALYGRNATAGAINFISARPSDEMEGYADVSYGEYNALNIKAAVSGPVADNLQLRLAAIVLQGGGYMDRPGTGTLTWFTRRPGAIPGIPAAEPEDNYGDKDIFAMRASATLQLTPEVDAFITFHYGQDKSELIGSTNINGDRAGLFTPPNDDAFVDYDNISPKTDTEQYGGALRIDWSSGDYTFSSLTGFENLNRAYTIGDFVPTRIAEASFVEYIKSFSQEFLVAFDGGEQLQWLAGAAYTHDEIDYSRELVSYDLLLGGLGTSYMETDKSFAIFGQGELALNDQWLFTLGLRYTNEDKSYDGGTIELDPYGTSIVGLVFPHTAGAGLFGTPTYDETDLSGKAALNWQPTDNVLVYASLSKGFKSGGFDGSGISEPASFTPFLSESVWTYELGTKATLFSGHVFVTASAFYNDYKDKQVIALVDLGGGLVEAIIQNAASSKVYGLDFEAKWSPVQSLSFSLSGTFLNSEVTNWTSPDPVEIAAHIGNELPGSPNFSLTGKVDWHQPINDSLTFGAAFWVTYSDGRYRDILNNPELRTDAYTTFNARLDLIAAGGASIYLSGTNIFDKTYVTSRRSLIGMLGEYYGAPRSFLAGVRYEF